MKKLLNMYYSTRSLRHYRTKEEQLEYESIVNKAKDRHTAVKVIITNEFEVKENGEISLFDVECDGVIRKLYEKDGKFFIK